MKRFSVLSILLVLALLVGACSTPAPAASPTAVPTMAPEPTAVPAPELMDIVDTAAAAGSFTTLLAAADAAGLVDALKGDGPLTVFAPTDDAFAALPDGTVEALFADPEALAAILLYHVVPGKVMAADVTDGLVAETLNGARVTFSTMGGVMINGANIVATDVETSNGVIHVIDAVILPPAPEAALMDIVDTAAAAGSFNTLLAAAEAAGLVDALKGDGPFTVFAPTDDAFAALPDGTVEALLADPEALADILLYHVVPGKVMAADVTDGLEAETLHGATVSFSTMGGVMINDANIVATDIEASNGVIHVIDAVILPPAPEAALMDIVDTAVAAGSFTTLLAAVEAAGLVDALKGDGPFTVFAPTDEAFAALPDGTVEALFADPEALASILLYHVVSGKVMAADVTDGLEAETLNGASVTFSTMGWGHDQRCQHHRRRHRDQQRRHPRHRRRHPAPVQLRLCDSLPPPRRQFI